MREGEWTERLWKQIGQTLERFATKEDVHRIEERLNDLATKEAVERLTGKLDTLLINSVTKIEVSKIERQMERNLTKEDFQKLEVRLSDMLPKLVTKHEWSATESKLARALTRDEFAHSISSLREELGGISQKLHSAIRQMNSLRKFLLLTLLLNGLVLCLLLWVLLRLKLF